MAPDSKILILFSWSVITGILLNGLIDLNLGSNCLPLEISNRKAVIKGYDFMKRGEIIPKP